MNKFGKFGPYFQNCSIKFPRVIKSISGKFYIFSVTQNPKLIEKIHGIRITIWKDHFIFNQNYGGANCSKKVWSESICHEYNGKFAAVADGEVWKLWKNWFIVIFWGNWHPTRCLNIDKKKYFFNFDFFFLEIKKFSNARNMPKNKKIINREFRANTISLNFRVCNTLRST